MKYNLMGPEFQFSFQGKNLVPEVDYTLIYYPDPWPGLGLVCLGTGKPMPAETCRFTASSNFYMRQKRAKRPSLWDCRCPMTAITCLERYVRSRGRKNMAGASADVSCPGEEVGAMESTLVGWNPASTFSRAT